MATELGELGKDYQCLRKQLEMQRDTNRTGGNKQEGFTWIEMLVVIAVLGILASMLLPALSHAKSHARIVACKNNLRQMGHALTMYEGDFHDFPGAGDAVLVTNQLPWLLRSPE